MFALIRLDGGGDSTRQDSRSFSYSPNSTHASKMSASVSKWISPMFQDDHWSRWVTGAVATAISAVAIYKTLSWLKRQLVIARSKNRQDVIIWRRNTIDLNKQSKILPGPERIRASVLADGDQFLITLDPTVTTLYQNFLRGMTLSGDGPCLGYRSSPKQPFQWLTYGEVLNQAHQFGAGLVKLGLEPGAFLNNF